MGRFARILFALVCMPSLALGANEGREDADEYLRSFSKVSRAIHEQRFLDAHIYSLLGEEKFFLVPEKRIRFQLFDAISLWKLGDKNQAIRRAAMVSNASDATESDRKTGLFFQNWFLLKAEQLILDSDQSHIEDKRFAFYEKLRRTKKVPSYDHFEFDFSSLHEDLLRYENLDRYSPTAAGVLSGVVPGMGHFYLGQTQNALLTFVLNALTISASVEFFRKDFLAPGAASAALASIFYVGGIVSSVRQTKIQNQKREKPLLDSLEPKLFPELILKP